jgi:hypothetical protein
VKTPRVLLIALAIIMLAAAPCLAQGKLARGETQKIAEEAFIYGFPMVMSYGIMYEYFADQSSGQYEAPVKRTGNINALRRWTPPSWPPSP